MTRRAARLGPDIGHSIRDALRGRQNYEEEIWVMRTRGATIRMWRHG